MNQVTLTAGGSTVGLNPGVLRTVRLWFDPSRDPDHEAELGSPPDYRFSMANERTFLAWIRTSLALVGGGLAVAAFAPPLRWPYVLQTVAVVLLVVGAAVALRAVDHWARCERAMRLGQPLPRSRFPALLTLMVAVGSAVLLVLLLLSGPL